MSEFTNYLGMLDTTEYLNDVENIDISKRTFNVSDVEDLPIRYGTLMNYAAQELECNEKEPWRHQNQNTLTKNLHGYGRSFILDRNEFYYLMKNCFYQEKFTDAFITIVGRYNLEMSLIDSETSLVNKVHDLFAFVSSLGHDGFLGSSYDKIPSSIKKASNEINYGFSFFTMAENMAHKVEKVEFEKARIQLISNVANISSHLWKNTKESVKCYSEEHLDFNKVISESFKSKIDFLKTTFHSMIYLSNLDYSVIEKYESGADLLDSKGANIIQARDKLPDDNVVQNKVYTISNEIILDLDKLLYMRTKFTSEYQTEESLLQNILEFVPIFLNLVIENQVMNENGEGFSEQFNEVARGLRYLLDYNDDKYYNSAVLIYEQLIKIIDDKRKLSSIFRANESVVIKKMMAKITHSNCTEEQYLTTIKFMIAYSSLADGALHLFEERVISALVSAHCLKNLDDHEYYEIKERNSKHILWLWTLHLMRQLSAMLIHSSEFTYPLVNFITAFEDRIMRVLKFQGYLDGKKQYKTFTIARLEEIEHIINLIAFTFLNYEQWKAHNADQVDRIVNTLFSFTVNLYQPNVTLSESFHPVSQFEKYINNLTGDESSKEEAKDSGVDLLLGNKKHSSGYAGISQSDRNAMVNKVVTSLRTPMKGETSAKDFSMLEPDEYAKRTYKTSSLGKYMVHHYKPTGFILKIEITLTKIALMLLRSMHLMMKHEIRQGNISELTYYHEKSNETKLFLICTNIFDCVQFLLHSQNKWLENFTNVSKLNDVLNGASQNAENMIDSYISIFDVLDISNSSAEMGLLLTMILLKAGQLAREDTIDRGFLEIADNRLVEKIKSFSEECKQLTLKKEMVINEHKKINRRAYGKFSSPNLGLGSKDKNAKTNSDLILGMIEKPAYS